MYGHKLGRKVTYFECLLPNKARCEIIWKNNFPHYDLLVFTKDIFN